MEGKFITIFAEISGGRFGLTFTKNELKRGQRRFTRDVEKVRKEDIQDKRALTIDNGKSKTSWREGGAWIG